MKLRPVKPAALLICAVFAIASCTRETPPPEPAETGPAVTAAFNGETALEDLHNLVSFGSRAHGTPGHLHARGYLQARLQAAGLRPAILSFTSESSAGTNTFHTLEAVIPGTGPGLVLLTAHYDSQGGMPPDFEAANAAASGPAVLLETARALLSAGTPRSGPEIRLLFFDGQEPLRQHAAGDGLRGSTRYADDLVAGGEADRVTAVINVNMAGDRDLSVTIPNNIDPGLRVRLLEAARRQGVRPKFKLFPAALGDDHEPFLQRGMPAINIIDFEYGSAPGRNDYWRTMKDSADKVSAESLQTVGRVMLDLVQNLPASAGG